MPSDICSIRCQAMVDAEIKDPMNQVGIDFCTDECPYESCAVFDGSMTRYDKKSRVARARELSVGRTKPLNRTDLIDIARELDVSEKTIRRYLKV